MRTSFIETLISLAKKDERIFLLTGDLGYTVFEKFQSEFPKRFLNVGIAEQNMIGLACGLALSKKIVFVYSIVPFLTLRCLEQIRNDICYHRLNVKLIGVGGGFSYGVNGCTHHSLEDISIMKSLHQMRVICPGDPTEVESAVGVMSGSLGPYYLRLGKNGEPRIHEIPFQFEVGKGITVKEGHDITMISTGNMLENTRFVSKILEDEGISVRVVSMHTIKPLDREIILKAVLETKALFTVEEHSEIGGLGSSVSDVLTEEGCSTIPFKKIAVPDHFCEKIGSHEYLRLQNGLSKAEIAHTIRTFLRDKGKASVMGDCKSVLPISGLR